MPLGQLTASAAAAAAATFFAFLGRQSVLVALAAAATVVTVALLVLSLRSVPQRRRERPRTERRGRLSAEEVRKNPAEALALVGEALAATHNPRALLPVILEVVTEATGARGGRIFESGTEVSWIGEVDENGQPLTLELGPPGDASTRLSLYAPPGGFTTETRDLAEWLASQAAIALENARLHHIVQRQAVTDELTGLVNRRRFVEALGSELVRARAFGAPLAVVMADLDHFKLVNDRFGHAAGDEVLQRFAELIRAHLRDVDVPGRLGGEEFAILVPETDAAGAAAVAERVRSALGDARFLLAHPHSVSASFGVAQLSVDESGDHLLQRADRALYRAKENGRNCIVVDETGTPSARG